MTGWVPNYGQLDDDALAVATQRLEDTCRDLALAEGAVGHLVRQRYLDALHAARAEQERRAAI